LHGSPLVGDAWILEVKFDGWRIELHKQGRSVDIYTKSDYRCAHKLMQLDQGVKCPSWRERNRERWRLFQRP
jgi:ATP-dependent DNA ligase